MAFYYRKSFLGWYIGAGFALYFYLSSYLPQFGYTDINLFFEDLLIVVIRLSLFGGLVWFVCKRIFARSEDHWESAEYEDYQQYEPRYEVHGEYTRSDRIGRTTRCYRCKCRLQEHTGSNCHFCGWIRCSCGACGCGFGKMI